MEVGACQWPGPASGREPGPGPEKELLGGGGKTGWTSPAFLGCWLLQPQWIWVRETSLEKDPQGLPYSEEGHSGSGIRLEQRPHSVLGRARASPEKWEDPGTPNHTGTKGRRTQGWAGGRGG